MESRPHTVSSVSPPLVSHLLELIVYREAQKTCVVLTRVRSADNVSTSVALEFDKLDVNVTWETWIVSKKDQGRKQLTSLSESWVRSM